MTIQWWNILIMMGSSVVAVLLAVFLGGWLVFKAKTITMPTPFIQLPKKKHDNPATYTGDLFDGDEPIITDEELSSPAARLRGQKLEPESDKEGILNFVRGKAKKA